MIANYFSVIPSGMAVPLPPPCRLGTGARRADHQPAVLGRPHGEDPAVLHSHRRQHHPVAHPNAPLCVSDRSVRAFLPLPLLAVSVSVSVLLLRLFSVARESNRSARLFLFQIQIQFQLHPGTDGRRSASLCLDLEDRQFLSSEFP